MKRLATFDVVTVELTNSAKSSYEYKVVVIDGIVDTCYVRVCWDLTETTRKCTEWQGIPCDTEIELEGDRIEE